MLMHITTWAIPIMKEVEWKLIKKKAKYYYELEALNGDMRARHYLGSSNCNYPRAFKHYIIAAKAGYRQLWIT